MPTPPSLPSFPSSFDASLPPLAASRLGVAAAAGTTFLASLWASQLALGLALRLLPKAAPARLASASLGAAAVLGASAASAAAAAHARRHGGRLEAAAAASLASLATLGSLGGSLGDLDSASAAASSLSSSLSDAASHEGTLLLRTVEADAADFLAGALGCALLYRLALGGRFGAVAPSDVRLPGAFAGPQRYWSIPTGVDYASASERALIQKLGRRHGCHTCGTRRSSTKFIADHQPPNKYAKRENAWRAWVPMLRPVRQSYYAQCEPCSHLQGVTLGVAKDKPRLVFHWGLAGLRPYHAAGFYAALLHPRGLGG